MGARQFCVMRTGTPTPLPAAARTRLEALIRGRDAVQKHAWRADIVLLSAPGVGTNGIVRRTGTSKTFLRRWQARFTQGVDGLLRDKASGNFVGKALRSTEADIGKREPLCVDGPC
jgi:hypothetical protein